MLYRLRVWMIVIFGLFCYDTNAAVSGNDWNSWNASLKDAYISGVIDTWGAAEVYRLSDKPPGPANNFTFLTNCAKSGMTYPQFDAIVQKWMDENPGEWHKSMTFLILKAMANACHLQKVAP